MNKIQLAIISLLVVIAGFLGFIVLNGVGERNANERAGVWEVKTVNDRATITGMSDDGYLKVYLHCDVYRDLKLGSFEEHSLNTGKPTGEKHQIRGFRLDDTDEFVTALDDDDRKYAYIKTVRFSKGNYPEVRAKATKVCDMKKK